MLTRHERQVLAEIEDRLRESDPEFARTMGDSCGAAPPRFSRVRRLIGLAGLSVGAILLVTALAVRSADVAVLAGALLLADATWWTVLAGRSLFRRRSSRAQDGSGPV